jgi:hypothetical protein
MTAEECQRRADEAKALAVETQDLPFVAWTT